MSKEVSHKSFGVRSEIYLVSMNPNLQLIYIHSATSEIGCHIVNYLHIR